MPTQASFKKYTVLLHAFQTETCLSAKQLIYRLEDDGVPVSKRTFLRLIETLRKDYAVDIVYDAESNLYYTNTRTLKQEKHLDELLRLFKYAQFTEFVTDVLQNPVDGLKKIDLQTDDLLIGINLLPDLFRAIQNHQVISIIKGKSVEDWKEKQMVYPYLLKEYAYKWYLIGTTPENNHPQLFSVDKMDFLQLHDDYFKPSSSFPYRSNFWELINEDQQQEKSQHIKLNVHPDHIKKMQAFPLHPAQKVRELKNGQFELTIKHPVNEALIQKILQYGHAVKVLSPAALQQTIREILAKNLQQYS